MKATIGGQTYNTKMAVEIGCANNGLPCNDLDYWYAALYKANDGRYFLAGDGGARTIYADVEPGNDNWTTPGKGIVPMTAAKAEEWAREWLDDASVVAEFGALDWRGLECEGPTPSGSCRCAYLGTLGELVARNDPALRSIVLDGNGAIDSWPDHYVSAVGEESDCYTPRKAADWFGFHEALQAALKEAS